jgi:tetratricopeptide (TPR) repeat protein
VLVGDFIWADPRGAAAALMDAEQAIRQGYGAMRRTCQSRTGIAPEMKILRPISILLSCSDADGGAAAQVSLTPPGREKRPRKQTGRKEAPKSKGTRGGQEAPSSRRDADLPRLRPAGHDPSRRQPLPRRPTIPMSIWSTAPISAAIQDRVRSRDQTRAQYNGDPKAMTMLGELYANALGVKRDYAKAAEWYKRAADAGDREGMFALAMLRLSGRGGPANREEAVKLLASSAKLGNPKAAYNLALLYLDGQTLPQDLKRAAELLRVAADAGNPEAQYALATFYKEGTGVRRTSTRRCGCCRRLARRQCRRRGRIRHRAL